MSGARRLAIASLVALALMGLGAPAARAATGITAAASPVPAFDPGAPAEVSRLGLRRVDAAAAEGLLAQRTIEREWGPSDDSVYVEVEVPGWKSVPLAGALSMALPGTGQLYAGDRTGWLYLAVEAVGWGGWWWYHSESVNMSNQAVNMAGPPEVASSGWSFERWSSATQGDPSSIAALYAADREAYYNRIAADPAYMAGWVNATTHADFSTVREDSDEHLSTSRYFSAGLWINHLLSALTALRSARQHNMSLAPKLGLRVRPHVSRRDAGITMVLERKF